MNKISLKQAYDLFIFDRTTYCSNKTVENYEMQVGYFIDYLEEKRSTSSDLILINDIKTLDLQEYVLMLKKRDKFENHKIKNTVEGKSVTNTTIRTYLIAIRTFFNFLYEEEYMEHNIMRRFRLIGRDQKQIIPLYEDDVKDIDKMFNIKTETGIRNYCIIHLMLDAGLRSGEVCNLKIEDVDCNHGIISIVNGKGNKSRLMPIVPMLKQNLYKYMNLFRPFKQDESYLFLSVDKRLNPITDCTIKSLFSRIRKKTCIERLKPHLLRHTFATSFIIGGGNLEMLRIYLGHSTYDITRTYLHTATFYANSSVKIYELDKIYFKTMYSN